jgi:hypothetical protein
MLTEIDSVMLFDENTVMTCCIMDSEGVWVRNLGNEYGGACGVKDIYVDES